MPGESPRYGRRAGNLLLKASIAYHYHAGIFIRAFRTFARTSITAKALRATRCAFTALEETNSMGMKDTLEGCAGLAHRQGPRHRCH